jgi:hypothetical protein
MSSPEHAVNVNGTESDFLWGCDQIAKAIGRSSRQTFHILNSGELKTPKKLGGRWVVSRSALLRELGAA